jgi:hypothetical protein
MKSKRLSRFPGLFQHSGLTGLLYSCPNKFPHSSPEAPRIIQMRETSTIKGGNNPPNFEVGLNLQESCWDFLHAAKLGYGTLFYFPSEGRHTEEFSDARKIQRLWPGLNLRTRVPVVSMLTTRPPKPSWFGESFRHIIAVSHVLKEYVQSK